MEIINYSPEGEKLKIKNMKKAIAILFMVISFKGYGQLKSITRSGSITQDYKAYFGQLTTSGGTYYGFSYYPFIYTSIDSIISKQVNEILHTNIDVSNVYALRVKGRNCELLIDDKGKTTVTGDSSEVIKLMSVWLMQVLIKESKNKQP
jgi:hypothetical protein